jgi:hypothetical protein
MEKVLEAILKLIPFAAAFGYWEISKDTSAGLAVVAVAVLLLVICPWIKKLQQNLKNARIAEDLSPYFTRFQIDNSRKLFNQTRFQNHSPNAAQV